MFEDFACGVGAPGSGANVSCCVVTPEAFSTCPELTVALPGHQAMNNRPPTVALIVLPSESTSFTPVTPAATCPWTNVYCCPRLVVRPAAVQQFSGLPAVV